jgi:hypothetical protein
MNQISSLSRISDVDAARVVGPETLADLAERISSTPARPGPRHVRRLMRRPRMATIALVAALAAVVLVVTTIGGAQNGIGPLAVGPGSAQALSFTTSGGFINVIVRNPLADPARYRAEFAAHHLDITLKLVPASPSTVGTVVAFGGTQLQSLDPITARGKCVVASGGSICPVGVRVPLGYRGSGEIVFGRAARPGEQYVSGGSATAPGEAMHGLRYRGRTVATVLALLRARHVTVPQYRYVHASFGHELRSDQVPSDWYVLNAIPWAPGQVLLFVGPTPKGP